MGMSAIMIFKEIPANRSSIGKRKLIQGVGINDAWYIVSAFLNGKNVKCPYYNKWRQMITRCYSKKALKAFPTYKCCTVCDEWLLFSNFRRWMETQDWEGKELDKDLKSVNNKIYSPETCIFLPKYINYLLINCENDSGDFLKGVSFDKRRCKFMALCRTPSKRKFLGYFNNQEDAHHAYITYKKELILSIAKTQPDHIRSVLENYNLKIG